MIICDDPLSLNPYLSLSLQGTGVPEVIAEAHCFHWEFIDAKLDPTYTTFFLPLVSQIKLNIIFIIEHIKTFSTGRRVIVSRAPSSSLDPASLLH